MNRVTIDCVSGMRDVTSLTADTMAKMQAVVSAQQIEQANDQSRFTDLATKRAQVIADLQLIQDATTLTQIRPPLLRTLVFVLKLLREQVNG